MQILPSIPNIDNSQASGVINQENIQNTVAKSKQVVSDNFESNSTVNALKSTVASQDVSMRDKLLLVPVLSVINKSIDALMGGAEEKSLLTKIAHFGDKVSHVLHLDNILSEQNSGRISNFIKTNKFTKYFTNDYKAIAKSSMAKGVTMAEKYSKELDGCAQGILSNIRSIANSQEAMDALKNASQETLDVITSAADSKFSTKQILDVVDDLMANGINVDTKGKLSEFRNKLKASNLQIGETLIGKNLAKGTIKTKDILTYGGDLLSLFFAASAILQAAKAAKDAPKGEKKATFAHVLSEQYLGIALLQPCTNLLYKIGGNKYRGMTIEGREALKTLVQTTNADRNITKEGLKIAKMQRDLLIKGVSKDKVETLAGKGLQEAKTIAKSLKKDGAKLAFWEKPLKFMGKILDSGLDTIKKSKYVKLPKIGEVKLPKPTLKGFAGGAARLLLIMLVIQPLIQKPITKLCHKIFGKPESYLKKQEEKNDSPAETSAEVNPLTADSAQSSSETNLLRRFNNNESKLPEIQTETPEVSAQTQPQDASAAAPITEKTEEEIPAINIFNKDDKKNSGRYIPSIEVDTSYMSEQEKAVEARVNQLLKETDATVKKAKKSYN